MDIDGQIQLADSQNVGEGDFDRPIHRYNGISAISLELFG